MFQPPHHQCQHHPLLLQHQVHHQPQNAMVSCLISPPLHATTKVVQNLNQEVRTAKFAVKDATCTRIQAKEPSAWRTRWMSRWLEQFFFSACFTLSSSGGRCPQAVDQSVF